MLYIDDGFKRWKATLSLAWEFDHKGIILPLKYVHIAACTIHAGAVILTHDRHFQMIPGIDPTGRIF